MLEPGLVYVDRQVILGDGNRIDILAKSSENETVIIEIKKGTADDGTVTQVASYLHQYHKQFPSEIVIGKIVCLDASYRMKAACQHFNIKIHFYGEVLSQSIQPLK